METTQKIPRPLELPANGVWNEDTGEGLVPNADNTAWVKWGVPGVMPERQPMFKKKRPGALPAKGVWNEDTGKGLVPNKAGTGWDEWKDPTPLSSTGKPIDSGRNRAADALSKATGFTNKGQAVPPIGPAYIAGAATNLAKKAGKFILEVPPAIGKAIGNIDPQDVTKTLNTVSNPFAIPKMGQDILTAGKNVGGAVVGSFKEEVEKFKRNPKAYIYTNPDVVVDAALLLAGGPAVVKAVAKVAKVDLSKTMTGAAYKALISKIPDELLPMADKSAIKSLIPDNVELNVGKKFARLPEEGKVADLAGTLGVPGQKMKWSEMAKQSDDMKGILDKLPVPVKTAGQRVTGIFKSIGQTVHSPEVSFGKHPLGQVVYNMAEKADRAGKLIIDNMLSQYKRMGLGIRKGDAIDTGVFKMRDNRLTLDELLSMLPAQHKEMGFLPDELEAMAKNRDKVEKFNNFLNNAYEFSIRKWGMSKLTPGREDYLWAKARKARGNQDEMDRLDVLKHSLTDQEKAVLDQYTHLIPSYTPHIWDKDDLVSMLGKQVREINVQLKSTPRGTPMYENLLTRRIQLDDSIKKITNGKMVYHEDLPKGVKFGFFEERKGAGGYEKSALEGFDRYLHGIARKTYDEPVMHKFLDIYDKLPDDMKDYAKKFMRHFGGYDRKPVDRLWDGIKSVEWMRTLGINPRSAITNLTQRINKWADVPVRDAIEGQLYSWTDEAKELFEGSGLKSLVSEQLMEGAGANRLDRARDIVGWMFQKVEEGNLRDSFSTGYLMAMKKGLSKADSIESGVKMAQKHHFRYGRIGTSRLMRGGGGVAFQFAGSYPVKQLEFLSKIAKEDPVKLIKYIAISEGIKGTAADVLGIDISNAVGIPMDVGSFLSAVSSVTEGDIRKAMFNLEQTPTSGGFMPQGPGPAMGLVLNAWNKRKEGIGAIGKQVAQDIKPVFPARLAQAGKALVEKDTSGYPIRGAGGNLMYKATPENLIKRTFVGTPVEEKQAAEKVANYYKTKGLGDNIVKMINHRIATGDYVGAERLIKRYKLMPTDAGVKAALEKLTKTGVERLKPMPSRGGFEEYIKR